jgi:hypothetical protein
MDQDSKRKLTNEQEPDIFVDWMPIGGALQFVVV